MSENLTTLVAELRERIRRLEAEMRDVKRDLTGAGDSVTVAPHTHSGGGQGGPLAQGKVSDYVQFVESAAPGTPPSGSVRLYAKSDGRLYSKDDAGTESGPL